jgi:hypothetical protein
MSATRTTHATHRWLLRLYPRDWRERYEDEYAALLEECALTPLTILDVGLGALDARLHADALTGRRLSMSSRLRAAEIMVFCGYILFVVAGLGFQKMSEDMVKAGVMDRYAAIGLSFDTLMVGAVAALLAVLAGGLPIAFAALRYARSARRMDIPLLFAVPPVALALWVGYTIVLVGVVERPASPTNIHQLPGLAILLSWVVVFALAAVASTAAVSAAVARSQIGEAVFRFALGPAAVATLAMVAMLTATIVWGLSLRAQAPQFYNGNDGLLASNTAASWMGHVAVMTVATALSIAGLVRGFKARGLAAAAA